MAVNETDSSEKAWRDHEQVHILMKIYSSDKNSSMRSRTDLAAIGAAPHPHQ
jgi:hypothetical protein